VDKSRFMEQKIDIEIGLRTIANAIAGWAKYMEWQYPVEIVVTSPKLFRAAGAVEVAASL
jgi:hypothetical protein